MENSNVIIGLGGNAGMMEIQKSRPLLALWKSDLTLGEFKLLDVYLARINSHDPSKRTVVFKKGEFERLIGVEWIREDDLQRRLDHLMGSIVTLPDQDEDRGFRKLTLFDEAHAVIDSDRTWNIELSCTEKAMKYFFNIDKVGYLRYKLRNIASLVSKYSYTMFLYIESNAFRVRWEEDIDKLREILGCAGDETYRQYKFFNAYILKRVCEEITQKTPRRYTYTPIKQARKIVAIRFEVEKLSEMVEKDINANAVAILGNEATPLKGVEDEDMYIERFGLWWSAVEQEYFSDDKLLFIKELLYLIPSEILPHETEPAVDDVEWRRLRYMRLKVKILNIYRPGDRYNYLIKLMRVDAGLEK